MKTFLIKLWQKMNRNIIDLSVHQLIKTKKVVDKNRNKKRKRKLTIMRNTNQNNDPKQEQEEYE